jgi:hypothetical protein
METMAMPAELVRGTVWRHRIGDLAGRACAPRPALEIVR